MTRMRVLFVLDSLGPGGAERSTAALLPLLAERGVECSVAVLRGSDLGFESEVVATGTSVELVEGRTFVGRVASLRRLIRARRPDIVHSAIYAADQTARLACVGLQVRLVSSLISMPRERRYGWASNVPPWKTWIVNRFDRSTGKFLVDRFHAVTPGVESAFVESYKIRPSSITVVPRGRDETAFIAPTPEHRRAVRQELGLAPEDRIILGVGRLDTQKGFDTLVQAFGRIDPSLNAVLLIAGRDGSAHEAVRAAIDQLGDVGRRVHLLGHRDDVLSILAASDVMVLSSRFEGAAGAALEAMGTGIPLVSTRLPGLEGIVRHERNALVCDIDDVLGMAEEVRRSLSEPELAARLSKEACADFLRRFTVQAVADATLKMYEGEQQSRKPHP